jgi:hypothetical protein
MSNRVIAFATPAGRLVQDVTSLTVVNATSKTQDFSVPQGKRWILVSIKCTNPDDVARVISFTIYKEAAKTNDIALLYSASVNAASRLHYPNSGSGSQGFLEGTAMPYPLESGNTISVVLASGGASAGGTDADGIVLCYWEIDL